MNIVILGTANPYRGGIAAFNERMAWELQSQGHHVEIYNFSLQYPDFLFPGSSQYLETPHIDKVPTYRKVNSLNPLNWIRVGWELMRKKPDRLILKYWISYMAPCYTVIAWLTKRNGHTKIATVVDNAISHEPKFYETFVGKLFFNLIDKPIVMSDKVARDLVALTPKHPVHAPHPLYDHYPAKISKSEARTRLGLNASDRVILFFGFIREYKGLDILLKAMADTQIQAMNIKLIVAGEFYTDSRPYYDMVDHLGIHDIVSWHSDFIADERVVDYFCAADVVVLPYKSATQSGVTQVAFHYHIPVIATRVGGIHEMVSDEEHGFIVSPNQEEIAQAIIRFYENNLEEKFSKNIERDNAKYSWSSFVRKLVE